MKFSELVKKIETLSQEEMDKLIDEGLVLENIKEFIYFDKEDVKQMLFKNEKLKQIILKEINSFVIPIFEAINKNPNWKMHPNVEKIIENYLKSFFRDGLALEITTDKGRYLANVILNARVRNEFMKRVCTEKDVCRNYRGIIQELVTKDISSLSKQEVKIYDKIFGDNFVRTRVGYTIPETETVLKMCRREDIDIRELTAMEFLIKDYEQMKINPNIKIPKEDEVFSTILDYDVILREKYIRKENLYSPIKEMEQAIRDGNFGIDNKLSKKEMAFVLKFLGNPFILYGETNEKMWKFLENPELELEIGDREINKLLSNKGNFDLIGFHCPNLENKILEKIESNILNILQDICKEKRNITQEEMKRYFQYINSYYDISLEKNSNTLGISEIVLSSINFAYPDMSFNIRGNRVPKETSKFFENIVQTNNIFEKYDATVMELMRKIKMESEITKDEFELYNQIIKDYSYVIELEDNDNIEIISTLAKKSEEINMSSIAIENQIEKYIKNSTYKCKEYNKFEFLKIILNYYEKQLNGNAIEINENSAVSHLIKAAQKGKIPQDIATTVLDKLEERKNKNEIKLSNEDNLEQYMEKVAEIRLQKGLMPRECCEFIIKQTILDNEEMNKYKGMVERAIEDYTEYELKDSQMENYSVMVFDQPYLGININGSHVASIKHINLSRQTLQAKGMIKLLETSLHECTHAEQEDKMEKGDLNRDTYKMLKEDLLSDEYYGFYKTNYYHMYNEIDARKGGYIKRLKALRKIGLTDKEITKLQANDVKKTIRDYCKHYEEGKVKTKGEETKDINNIFLELLQEKPQLLWDHSELQIEFEKNGYNIQKKSLAKVLKTYERLLGTCENKKEIEKISGICSEILLNGGDIPQDKLKDELDQLMTFNSDNKIINAYKNKVLTIKFPREMVMKSSMKSMYKNHSQQKRTEAEQVLKQVTKINEKESQQNEKDGGREK